MRASTSPTRTSTGRGATTRSGATTGRGTVVMEAIERVGRPLGRALAVVRPLGWWFALAGALLTVSGLMFGWLELTVPGIAFVLAVLLGIAMTLGRSRYHVNLRLADVRVTVGERAMGQLDVRNRIRRRLLPSVLTVPVGARAARFRVPSLGSGQEFSDVFAIPTVKRSVVVVGPCQSVRGDALGMAGRTISWDEPQTLYVHPRTVSLAGATSGVLRDLEGQATRVISDNDMSFHALREYVPGDDRRNIHWKSTARLGTIMVRQFEDTRRTHTALGLVTNIDEYVDTGAFELAISALASIGRQDILEQRATSALTAHETLRTDTAAVLLDGFAGIEPNEDGTGGSTEVAGGILAAVPDASLAVLATGTRITRRDLQRAVTRLPAGTRTLAIQCDVGADPTVFRSGSASYATLGRLEDLRRILVRAVAQ